MIMMTMIILLLRLRDVFTMLVMILMIILRLRLHESEVTALPTLLQTLKQVNFFLIFSKFVVQFLFISLLPPFLFLFIIIIIIIIITIIIILLIISSSSSSMGSSLSRSVKTVRKIKKILWLVRS